MIELHYYIEQADNGMVIADRKDRKENETAESVSIVMDDDARNYLGNLLYSEIYEAMDAAAENGADVKIIITAQKGKL